MLYPYEGQLTCCRLNHERNGMTMRCDKTRLVDVLVGLYGQVLAQTMAANASNGKLSVNAKAKAVRTLAETSERMFPSEFFGRSVEVRPARGRALCITPRSNEAS